MEPYKQDGKELENVAKENFPVYERRKALEEARLKEAINRTPAEKFSFLMTLMKMNRQMRNATIHYK